MKWPFSPFPKKYCFYQHYAYKCNFCHFVIFRQKEFFVMTRQKYFCLVLSCFVMTKDRLSVIYWFGVVHMWTDFWKPHVHMVYEWPLWRNRCIMFSFYSYVILFPLIWWRHIRHTSCNWKVSTGSESKKIKFWKISVFYEARKVIMNFPKYFWKYWTSTKIFIEVQYFLQKF